MNNLQQEEKEEVLTWDSSEQGEKGEALSYCIKFFKYTCLLKKKISKKDKSKSEDNGNNLDAFLPQILEDSNKYLDNLLQKLHTILNKVKENTQEIEFENLILEIFASFAPNASAELVNANDKLKAENEYLKSFLESTNEYNLEIISTLKQEKKELEKALKNKSAKNFELEKEIEDFSEQLEEQNDNIEKLKSQITEKDGTISSFKKSTEQYQENQAEAVREITELKQRNEKALSSLEKKSEDKIKKLKEVKEKLESDKEKLKEDLSSLGAEIKICKNSLEEKDKIIDDLRKFIEQKEKERDDKLNEIKQEIVGFRRESNSYLSGQTTPAISEIWSEPNKIAWEPKMLSWLKKEVEQRFSYLGKEKIKVIINAQDASEIALNLLIFFDQNSTEDKNKTTINEYKKRRESTESSIIPNNRIIVHSRMPSSEIDYFYPSPYLKNYTLPSYFSTEIQEISNENYNSLSENNGLEEESTEIKQEVESLKKRLEKTEEEKREWEDKFLKLQEKIKRLISERRPALKTTHKELTEKIESLQRELDETKQNIQIKQENLKRARIIQKKLIILHLKSAKRKFKKNKLDEINSQLTTEKANNQTLQNQLNAAQENLENRPEIKKTDWENDYSQRPTKNELDNANKSIQELKSELELNNQTLNSCKNNIKIKDEEIKSLNSERNQLEAKKRKLEEDFEVLEKEKQTLKQERNEYHQQLTQQERIIITKLITELRLDCNKNSSLEKIIEIIQKMLIKPDHRESLTNIKQVDLGMFQSLAIIYSESLKNQIEQVNNYQDLANLKQQAIQTTLAQKNEQFQIINQEKTQLINQQKSERTFFIVSLLSLFLVITFLSLKLKKSQKVNKVK